MRAPQISYKKGKASVTSQKTSQSALEALTQDMTSNMSYLLRTLSILDSKTDLPVAFATNTLYVLERNGLGDKQAYERVLLPTLRKKADYLHAEGVAQAAWALANAQIHDQQIWSSLKNLILTKDFDYTIVKNERFSASYYQLPDGKEHFLQGELSDFANNLFF